MAVAHIAFNDQITHGRLLRRALSQMEESLEGLGDLVATIALMIDGDGSQVAHFTYVTSKFGFTDNATAKAGYEELQSVYGKLSTNASVSSVNAALLQAFNKFR